MNSVSVASNARAPKNSAFSSTVQLKPQQYYELIRLQIDHEDQLIGTRMGWLTTSQTILIGFYANGEKTSNASLIPLMPHSASAYAIIALVGFLMTISIYISIIAAVLNLHKLRSHIRDIVKFVDEAGKEHPVPNVTSQFAPIWRAGLLAPWVVPAVFVVAWIGVAVHLIASNWGAL